jgi:thioester reductase-like protein
MTEEIQKFFKDKTLFITGGAGFMGKVLLEKLLYSCSDLKEILVLVRPKKGKSAEQRVHEFADDMVSTVQEVFRLNSQLIFTGIQ